MRHEICACVPGFGARGRGSLPGAAVPAAGHGPLSTGAELGNTDNNELGPGGPVWPLPSRCTVKTARHMSYRPFSYSQTAVCRLLLSACCRPLSSPLLLLSLPLLMLSRQILAITAFRASFRRCSARASHRRGPRPTTSQARIAGITRRSFPRVTGPGMCCQSPRALRARPSLAMSGVSK